MGSSIRSRLGIQPDSLHDLFHSGALIRAFPDLQPLGNDVFHTATRVQRRYGVLKNHLQGGAGLTQSLALKPGDILALENHLSAFRWRQLHDCAPNCRLAATRLSDQPKCFATGDIETDIGNSLDEFATHIEGDHKMLNFQDDIVSCSKLGIGCFAHAPTSLLPIG